MGSVKRIFYFSIFMCANLPIWAENIVHDAEYYT